MSKLILAFDTAGPHCAVALLRDGTVLEQVYEPMAKGQAERLMGLILEVLKRHNVELADLAAIGVGTGPGNFTGIRISVSAARGLALGLGVPAYGITGFEQLAICLPDIPYQCVPAPREQVYLMRDGVPKLVPQSEVPMIPPAPAPNELAGAIAMAAQAKWPAAAPSPAPYYLRAPDAAPARDAPPVILS